MMGAVRRFTEADIPEVAALHWRIWGDKKGKDQREMPQALKEEYESYFRQIFLEHPWENELIGAQVFEEGRRIVGFLGVVPREMVFDGKSIQTAVGTQFVVEPGASGKLASVWLLKGFLSGPQELSLTDEATDRVRIMWEGLGGTTSYLNSLYWTRPLRPSQFVASTVGQRRILAGAAWLCRPIARVLDYLATHIPRSHFRMAPLTLLGEDLREDIFLSYRPEAADAGSLRPTYDSRTFRWIIDKASRKGRRGDFYKVAVRSCRGELAGWYLYCANAEGLGEVIQIVATSQGIHDVLDHLFYHAWSQGLVALSGRLEPRFMQALSDKYCIFHRRGPWVLVHSKWPELRTAILESKAFLSRLEGEWCLGFR